MGKQNNRQCCCCKPYTHQLMRTKFNASHGVITYIRRLFTWASKQFLCHQDNGWGILLFLTQCNARRLQQCQDLYIDGTFKSCPKPYYQLVTIHAKYQGRVMALAFYLMNGKEVGTYRRMLQQVKRKVRHITGHNLRPRRVICDFEISLIVALETELPTASVRGCYFHFC
jgi:hypothetical protein